MDLKPELSSSKIKDRLSDRVNLDSIRDSTEVNEFDLDSGYLTAFLAGAAVSMLLITVLSVTGLLGNLFIESSSSSSINVLPSNEVGDRTVDMLNQRILHNTPNNVTGELVGVEPADPEVLSNFYEVRMKVKNPTSQQSTTVYVKKDASLLFLNHPRYFDREKYRPQQHQ